MRELELRLDGVGELPVEHPQHHGYVVPAAPSALRTASPVSRLTRSLLVSTATASALPTCTAVSVAFSVESAMTTGTCRARA